MKKLTIILFTTLSFFACKSTSAPMDTTKEISESNTKKSTKQTNVEEKTYDMVLYFISKGEGIDMKLAAKINNIVSEFSKANKVKIRLEKSNFGREGEVNYNFILNNLSTSKKKEFIKAIEAVIGKSDMVFVKFNQKPVQKR